MSGWKVGSFLGPIKIMGLWPLSVPVQMPAKTLRYTDKSFYRFHVVIRDGVYFAINLH